MIRLNQLVEKVEMNYEKYEFPAIYQLINNFCTVDLSQFYLDFAKDVVYIESENSYDRRAMQTVFYEVLVKLTKLLTPILPHTAEEIWSLLGEDEEYVQLAEMPEVETYENEAELMDMWNAFMNIRQDVQKALEEARNDKKIGKSFEAKLTIYPTAPTRDLFVSLNSNIEQLLIVSDLEIAEDKRDAPETALQFESLAIVVEHAPGETCERCRAIKEDVGTNTTAPTLCERCAGIVLENFPEVLVPKQ